MDFPADTPSQAAFMRKRTGNRAAKWVRRNFPAGTRVRNVVSGQEGTVFRHVPGPNAQGGTVVVDWDSGHRGRHSAGGLKRADA